MSKDAQFPSLHDQFRRLWPLVLSLYAPLLLLSLIMLAYWWRTGNDVSMLTRDPVSVVEAELLEFHRTPDKSIHTFALLHLPFYTGALANAGVLLWASSVSVAAFAWWRAPQDSPFRSAFLLSLATLSCILLADDLLLLHERVLPQVFALHGSYFLAGLGLLFVLHCVFFRSEIRRSGFLLFGIALACFGAALGVDLLPWPVFQLHFVEDMAKLGGIAGWTAYHWQVASQQVG